MRNILIILALLFSLHASAQWCCDKSSSGITCDNLEFVYEEVGEIPSYGFVGGDGTLFNGFNASATRISTGRYQITFTNPKPIPNYTVTFGNIDNFITRDGKHISVINGTQNANGFQVMTMTGDNGGAADILIDSQFNFQVACKVTRLVDVICTE